jgi:hypothetical protein
MVRTLLEERHREKQRAEELKVGRLNYCLQTSGELSQLLLNFAEQLDRKSIHPELFRLKESRNSHFDESTSAEGGAILPTSKTFP